MAMNEQMDSSLAKRTLYKFTPPGLRAGIAKDQLIFIIICSVAIAVAVVALVHSFRGGKTVATKWQCLDCNRELVMKTAETPPIECPKCGGQAVRSNSRMCPECGRENLINRVRLTEQGQARRQEIKAGGTRQEGSPGLFGPVATMMMLPMEIQYWHKPADGSYGWTSWMPAGSPAAMQFERSLHCSECGARLTFGPRSPKSKR